MSEPMSLKEMAGDLQAIIDGERPRLNKSEMGDYVSDMRAIDAKLAQPAQAVDVGAIRKVIKRIRWQAGNNNPKTHIEWADKLTRALSGKKAQAVDGWIDGAPTEAGWYWLWNYEAMQMTVHFVFQRPGHTYLCIEGETYGPAMKRDFLAVEKLRGKWAKAKTPPIPHAEQGGVSHGA